MEPEVRLVQNSFISSWFQASKSACAEFSLNNKQQQVLYLVAWGPVSLPPRGGPWELLAGVSDANRDRGRGGGFRYVCSSLSGGFGI